MLASCPTDEIVKSFSVATTSGLYSTIAGVMAGFAFVAVLFIITDDRKSLDADIRDVAAQALSAAFLALLLSAVCWAIVAGETVTAGRAATIEIFAGCGFAVAAVQLFYSIMLLIEARKQEDQSLHRYFMLAGGAFLCPAAFGLAVLGVTDYRQTSRGDAGAIAIWISLALFVLLVLVAVWLVLPKPRRSSTRGSIASAAFLGRLHPSQHEFAADLTIGFNPSWLAVALATVTLVLTSAFDAEAEPCPTGNLAFVIAILLATALVLANASVRFFHPPTRLRNQRGGTRATTAA